MSKVVSAIIFYFLALIILFHVFSCVKNNDDLESHSYKFLSCGDISIKKVDSLVTERAIINTKSDYVIKLLIDKEGNVLESKLVKHAGLTDYEINQIINVISELKFPCFYDVARATDGFSYEEGIPVVIPITKVSLDRINN